ncbi:TetR family transcriptional regulator [Sphingobium sp. BS19]|nr:TetR family transcriptional regulator [Sphingobium sp. BS19]
MVGRTLNTETVGYRGPDDHAVRLKVMTTAKSHFSRYGYHKTTVSDIARVIGFSKAYIYKYFDSKQAIGHAICSQVLGICLEQTLAAIKDGADAADRLRSFFDTICVASATFLLNDPKLYELAALSALEKWPCYTGYRAALGKALGEMILQGREAREFERKTPFDETISGIMQAMEIFYNPLMRQSNSGMLQSHPREVVNLVLRSLAP